MHFAAVSGLDSWHTEQVQDAVFADGAFKPAADQSKPFTAGASEGATPLRTVSHTEHLSFTSAAFVHMHASQVQLPAEAVLGGFKPAAAQLNPELVDAAGFGGAKKSKVGKEAVDSILAAS